MPKSRKILKSWERVQSYAFRREMSRIITAKAVTLNDCKGISRAPKGIFKNRKDAQ